MMVDESGDHPIDVEQSTHANISPLTSSTQPPVSSPDVTVPLNLNDGVDENDPSFGANRLKAKIWREFDLPKKIKGQWKAKCKHCPTIMSGNPRMGTSHLIKHFERCKGKKMKDIRQQVLQGNFIKDKFELSPYNFNQDASRNELAKMIILHEYPLKMVEHSGFRKFVKSVNPCFKMVSRNTIKKDCIKVFDILKKDVMQNFEANESRIAITTDMWTSSHQKKGFMVVTAHYIDNNWKFQSRIVRFIYVPSPHTGEVLCEALIQCLLDWNMDKKLSTITMDNCAANDAALNLLLEKLPVEFLLLDGMLLHMRCCAHILNLVVKEGLKVIEKAIENVRDSVSYWSGTPKKVEKFEETCRQLRVPFGKKLVLDCKTRWNSTYLMLEIALEYKDVFARLKIRDTKFLCFPSEDEWNTTREICSRLQLFYKATEMFSGIKYPTANLCFPNICEIKLEMNKWSIFGVEVIEKMSEMMFSKFNKYWSDVNGIMGVATVLDPRYKLVLLEYYFPLIYGNNGEYELEEILNLCRGLVHQYELKDRVNETGDSSGSVNASSFNDPSLCDFDVFASKRKRKSTKSELDLYLDEHVLPRTPDFDVLAWWKSNKGKYPILSQIARDILAVPVSTVASESAFSTSGRLISPHRSRLKEDTVEALMCSQNWMLVENENSDDGAYATIFYDSDDEKGETVDLELLGKSKGKQISDFSQGELYC